MQGNLSALQSMKDEIRSIINKRGVNFTPDMPSVYGKEPQTTTDPSLPNGEQRKGLEAISGGGSRVRNINVTIEKMVETLAIHSQTLREGASEMKQVIEEYMTRSIQGFEQSINNG